MELEVPSGLVKGLRSCYSLHEGLKLHAVVVELGLVKVPALAAAVVHMYLACKSVENARKVFDNISRRESGLWACMIAAYGQNGNSAEALSLFQRMIVEGVTLDAGTVITILNVCSDLRNLTEGKLVHTLIQGNVLEWNSAVADALVRMYSRCGSLEDARRVFDNPLFHKNVVSWTAMVSFYVEKQKHEQALNLFQSMLQHGVTPNDVTLVCILNACGLEAGRRVHSYVTESGLDPDAFVGNALVKMYRKTGSLEDACSAFRAISHKNFLVWSNIIAGHVQCGQAPETLKLFRLMQLDGYKPDKHTMLGVLDVCSSGSEIHPPSSLQLLNTVVESGLHSDTLVATALVKMTGEQGNLELANHFFSEIPHKDLAAWNCMISVCAKHERLGDALELLEQMKLEQVKPNRITYLSILSACKQSSSLDIGRHIHREIIQQHKLDAALGTGLVKMYGSCGCLEEAEAIFQQISEVQDVISWTAMIGLYAHFQRENEALKTFQRLQLEGQRPDKVTFVSILTACTSLIRGKALHKLLVEETRYEADPLVANALLLMYSGCKSLEDVEKSFKKMLEPRLLSWNVLLAAYAQNGRTTEAFNLFLSMEQEGISPDSFTLSTIINSHSNLTLFHKARLVHHSLLEAGVYIDDPLTVSLLNLYGKCGHSDSARAVFTSYLHSESVALWNAMLAAESRATEAVSLFSQMMQHGVEPDVGTLAGLLTKCSHAGFVEKGCSFFASMEGDHGITPAGEHFGCMIDMLGRGGWVDEARELARRMPMAADAVKWMAVLSSSSVHQYLPKETSVSMLESVEKHESSAPYTLLSNMLRVDTGSGSLYRNCFID